MKCMSFFLLFTFWSTGVWGEGVDIRLLISRGMLTEMPSKQLSARVSRPKPVETSATCCVVDKQGVPSHCINKSLSLLSQQKN